jgi:hypothetical protein
VLHRPRRPVPRRGRPPASPDLNRGASRSNSSIPVARLSQNRHVLTRPPGAAVGAGAPFAHAIRARGVNKLLLGAISGTQVRCPVPAHCGHVALICPPEHPHGVVVDAVPA